MNAILLGTLFVLIQLCLVLSAPKGCVRGVITAYRARENILMIEEIRVQLGFSVADSDIIKSFFASNRGSRERKWEYFSSNTMYMMIIAAHSDKSDEHIG
ncbi:hypothetical protein Q1695_016373 [Nippostrongylus brasiliensis]|nr:hypothetical protein Q1695_016373 [Nippostrongylus brasiliensis]